MIDRQLDYHAPADAYVYSRMSDGHQNKRSPEQQLDMINRKVRELSCNFRIVRVFTDRAISGRKTRRRPGLMSMLQALGHPNNRVSIILVDELGRLGRSDEIQDIKSRLGNRHGIRVLSALNNFADPFQLSGQVLDSMGQIIAKQENRTKAHQVVRGKIDAVRMKHWPGGKPPFGMRLQPFYKEERGRQVLDYSILVSDPETRFIVLHAFERAAQTGWGETLLMADLNQDKRIPDKYKPITTASLRSWFRNPIYRGDYEWNKLATDYMGDRRVTAENDQEKWISVRDYCEAIVSRDLWAEVEQLRHHRREIHEQKNHSRHHEESLDSATRIGRGVALRYLLSGLVVCAICKRAMQVTSCGGYTLQSGELRRYEKYYCPGSRSGKCTNTTTIPEKWLRREVVSRLLRRLFHTP